MAENCPSGKVAYQTEAFAVDALLDVWSRTPFRHGEGPITVYQCEDCGLYHFTSKGNMHERLNELINSGQLGRMRESARWEEKFRGR